MVGWQVELIDYSRLAGAQVNHVNQGCAQIERASFGKDAYDRKLLQNTTAECGEIFLLAAGDGTIDGYSIACMCARKGNLVASLASIAVAPHSRGKGAGLVTIKEHRAAPIVATSRPHHPDGSQLERCRDAVYERRGFSAVRRAPGYYADGEEGLLMRKNLGLAQDGSLKGR